LADPRSNWLVRALLDGTFGRLDEERRPSGLSGRRDYADLASSGELSGITMASYHTSPLTRAIAGTGMTYGTFDWMRNLPGENFTRRNILHAARDATRYGFGPNHREALKNYGILDRDDAARGEERFRLTQALLRRIRDDDRIKELEAQLARATSDEERRRIDAQIRVRATEIQEQVTGRFVAASGTPAARGSNQWHFDQAVGRDHEARLDRTRQFGRDDALRIGLGRQTTTTLPPAREGVINREADAVVVAATVPTRTDARRVDEVAALFGPTPPPPAGTQPAAGTGERRVTDARPPRRPTDAAPT
jgi:hypothetical protein